MSGGEEVINKAVETCENLQAMIDISANTLHSLRLSVQSNPSTQASQALREAESKLVKMFSRQLIAKATVANLKDAGRLAEYPNTEQWLRVVGLPSATIKGLVAHGITLDTLLKISPEQISEVMSEVGSHHAETGILNKAVGKLRAWTESQINGGSDKQGDLFWTEYTHGSPYFGRPVMQQSHISAQLNTSRPTSTSSVPRSSTSSVSSDHSSLSSSQPGIQPGSQHGTWSSHQGSHSGTMSSQYSNPSVQIGHGSTGAPRSPVALPPTPTQMKVGRSRPNTPPPQIRNQTVFTFPTSTGTPIQKSVSHESHFNRTVTAQSLDSLSQTSNILDELAVVNAKLDHRKPMHRIGHRFESKNFRPGLCNYCKKYILTNVRICAHCKYKCHKECESCVAHYSCGLSDDLVKEAAKYIDRPCIAELDSPTMSARGLRPSGLHHSGSHQQTLGSLSSASSSDPSSPFCGAYSAQVSPVCSQHFEFPQTSSQSSLNLHSAEFSIRESSKLISTISTINSQATITASQGTVASGITTDVLRSNDSDQTVIDSTSSEKTLPEAKGEASSEMHSPMLRQPSLSKALEEWDIPYQELVIEDLIGTGHVGTVHKGRWHGPVAIRKIPINPAIDLDQQLLAFKEEVATLKKTRHENIVLFMGACMKPPELAIVTSFVNGDTLYKDTRTLARWNLNKIVNIASQIVQGMGYLHSKDIVHKHLTSKNIFVERGEKVVISDFGLQNVSRLSTSHSSLGNTMRIPEGWLSYLAPEVIVALRISKQDELRIQLPFSKNSDVFAFGTIWYELQCGHFPHPPSLEPEVIIWQVGKGLKPSLYGMNQLSKEVKEIFMRCWAFHVSDRPSFSLLSHMLEKLPKKRLGRSPSHPIQLSKSNDSFFRAMEQQS